ncbi:MAG: 50S ribosomal protein P1 [Theionarchaea archaeon]|nr:50S ribosomal protein P1 [Theionarchaea archaeon]
MEYIYATLMLDALEKEVTEENLKRIIEAAGATPDEIQIKQLLAALEGVDIKDAVKTAALPVAAPAGPAPAAAGGAKEETAAEEEKEEEKEEEALEGLGALFG